MPNTATTLNSSASEAAGTVEQKQVARPLHVLKPLIAKDLREGREAAEQAAMPYYKAAGEKLIEAKAQLPHGQFGDWVKRNFKLSARTASEYMSFARTTADIEIGSALPFSSLRDHGRQTSETRERDKYMAGLHRRAMGEAVDHLKEREAESRLGLELINRGYKSLAKELHSDKPGGSREAMTRLNRVRDRLRSAV
jgi:Protein of unknown function (DUF3102)